MDKTLKIILLLGIVEVILLSAVGYWFLYAGKERSSSNPDPLLPGVTQPSDEKPALQECRRGGCSGQLCTDEEEAVSTCEWREEYGCYAKAECKRQATGQCGFTETSPLNQCLENARKTAPPALLAPEPEEARGDSKPEPW